MPDSSVIVPAHNLAALTDQCLRLVLESGAREVIVVDDASTDDTPAMLAAHGHAIQTITHTENAGFGRSCNEAAARASGRYLVFLNNDTTPLPGWLSALERYADAHPEAAMVGSKLLFPDGTIQHAGVVIAQDGYPRHVYAGFPAGHPAVNRARRFQIVTAACMLVRRSVFEEAGGFDTAFQNGFEDVDVCLRLGERGHEIHYCPEAQLIHLESVSPGRFKHRRGNVDLYRERWMHRVRRDDLDYYVADGLLRLTYEGRYPVGLSVSPLLATLDEGTRTADLERALRERARQIADLERENVRLRTDLGARGEDSPAMQYRRMRAALRDTVQNRVPEGATVLVVSNGDGSLLDFPHRRAWHLPRMENGAYAGYHPADSADALSELAAWQQRGAQYLLIPQPSLWWLEHYADFARHLETQADRLDSPDDVCALYALRPVSPPSS